MFEWKERITINGHGRTNEVVESIKFAKEDQVLQFWLEDFSGIPMDKLKKMSEYEVSPTWHELKNLIMAAPKYLKVEDKFDIEWMCTRKNIFREALNYLYNIGSFDKEA